jgi:hypothetical protein
MVTAPDRLSHSAGRVADSNEEWRECSTAD